MSRDTWEKRTASPQQDEKEAHCAFILLRRAWLTGSQWVNTDTVHCGSQTAGETVASTKSMGYCIPQCTGASQCTCHKRAAGPAERPRAFNNKTADFGCLATVAGAGDDLVVFKAPLCYLMLRHPFPASSGSDWVLRSELGWALEPRLQRSLSGGSMTSRAKDELLKVLEKYKNLLHLSVGERKHTVTDAGRELMSRTVKAEVWNFIRVQNIPNFLWIVY